MRQFTFIVFVVVLASVKADWNQPSLSSIQTRIIGGIESDPHQFPHQVVLVTDTDTLCSGTIIEENVILTAATCLNRIEKKVKVTAGVHDRTKNEPTQQIIESDNFLKHENWNPDNLYNNVGLIYLPKRLQLNEYVKKISIYRGTADLVGNEATVSGWGRYSDNSESASTVLRHVTNKIISNRECRLHFPISVSDSNICFSGEGGKSPCHGDPGAPLHIVENNTLFQAGIVSYGKTLCGVGYPSVFSRVSSFAGWIDNNIKA